MLKTVRTAVLVLVLVGTIGLSFGAGYTLGARNASGPEAGLDTVAEAWNIIFQDYVERDGLDGAALSRGAIEGMVAALDDPYTSYLDPESCRLGMADLEGKFEGIGAQVTMREGRLVVIAPIAGAPAAQAGIRAGDVLLEIDGRPTSEMSLAEAVLTIRGQKGVPVRLLVLHEGESEAVEIEIVRAEIELASVYSEMRGDIAYVKITYFSKTTAGELSRALEGTGGASGIILDLRSNPGGLLDTVVEVAGCFLEEGATVVTVVDNQGAQTSLAVEPGRVATGLPLVVLVDGYSASGSEVLAGALQDSKRAVVAGSQTYGKGSVNIMRRLGDGSGLYITTARWFTPAGRLIEGEGLEPDYGLEGEDAIQWAIDYLKASE